MSVSVVVLAAGKGTRMKSKTPKVLHKVAGREMVLHTLEAASSIEPAHLITVLGHESDQVKECICNAFPESTIALQTEQLGTGHAVMQTEDDLKDFEGDMLVLCGDVPLVDDYLVAHLMASHNAQENDITFVTAFVDDPTGLGRIIRDEKEDVVAIIEHKDASAEQRQIDEINVGIYVVKAPLVFDLLKQVDNNNVQNEYYLPDVISIGLQKGLSVGTYTAENAEELGGVNSRLQLAYAEDLFQNRMREKFMEEGVGMIDPQSIFFAWDTKIGTDVEIGPNVRFGEKVRLENNVSIEGNLFIENAYVNENVTIKSFSHVQGSDIGEGSTVGPFARLRPGAELGKNVKVGSFTELKKTKLGDESSVAHLSYIGDAEIGTDVNIGGGTITANYNHNTKEKFSTKIEDGVATGVNNSIVAPCTIGEKAYLGAGTTVIKDVPSKTLAVNKTEQVHTENYIKE